MLTVSKKLYVYVHSNMLPIVCKQGFLLMMLFVLCVLCLQKQCTVSAMLSKLGPASSFMCLPVCFISNLCGEHCGIDHSC